MESNRQTHMVLPPVQKNIYKHAVVNALSQIFEYCPGDGTRYLVQTTVYQAGSKNAEILGGCGDMDAMVVVWLNHVSHPMVVMLSGEPLARSYVQSKMDINKASATALTSLIAHLTGRPKIP